MPQWIVDLTTGFVERQYGSCRDDKAMAPGEVAPRDLCWGPERVTLVMAGHTTDLIKDATSGQWCRWTTTAPG